MRSIVEIDREQGVMTMVTNGNDEGGYHFLNILGEDFSICINCIDECNDVLLRILLSSCSKGVGRVVRQ